MSPRTRTLLTALVAVLSLALAACGGDSDDSGTEADGDTETTAPAADDTGETPEETDEPAEDESPTEAMEEEPAGGATVAVASSDLGDILVDGSGMTLYVFLPDDQGAPTCTDECAQAWPPVEGAAEAGEGADAALLGTTEHPAGLTQVTYDGWPLYYFANDQAPGDTNGQGVGDNWYVVSPAGEPVQEAAAAQAPAGY